MKLKFLMFFDDFSWRNFSIFHIFHKVLEWKFHPNLPMKPISNLHMVTIFFTNLKRGVFEKTS